MRRCCRRSDSARRYDVGRRPARNGRRSRRDRTGEERIGVGHRRRMRCRKGGLGEPYGIDHQIGNRLRSMRDWIQLERTTAALAIIFDQEPTWAHDRIFIAGRIRCVDIFG
uniref:Uncharacterized protein n=1 Tax=Spongospora subterranea TaxID=70186 RepID=A0A0H5R7S4_9EUKA|eukprot:CRZ04324.1 hypothetical protein [Spongospora subterranea]